MFILEVTRLVKYNTSLPWPERLTSSSQSISKFFAEQKGVNYNTKHWYS